MRYFPKSAAQHLPRHPRRLPISPAAGMSTSSSSAARANTRCTSRRMAIGSKAPIRETFQRATCLARSTGIRSDCGANSANLATLSVSSSAAPSPPIPSRGLSTWVNTSTRILRPRDTVTRPGQVQQYACPPGRRWQTESEGMGGFMNRRTARITVLAVVLGGVLGVPGSFAQTAAPGRSGGAPDRPGPTMKTLARGADFAAASIMPQATLTEERVLRAGGNAFDAIVAGQAVLGVVQPSANGIGSDAVLLVYDAKARRVFSINAEGTAPKLATIEWYKNHNGGKLPVDDSLLAGTVPGVVDAWYILLSRWGTGNFAELLAPAIELAERGVPVSRGALSSRGFLKYPTSMRVYGPPDGKAWQDGQMWKNPDLASTFRRLVEAEKEAMPQGRQAGLKAARDRFYKGDIAREMSKFSEDSGALFRYEDFANYSAKVEEPVSVDYHGYTVYKNPSASQGPTELIALNILEGYDLKKMGLNSADYIHTSVEAIKLAMADRDTYLGDMDFIRIPYQGLLSKAYSASRRQLIDPAKASLDFRPGNVAPFADPGYQNVDRPRDVTLYGNDDHLGDTSYISAVDRDRNMISFTPSLHRDRKSIRLN